MTIDNEHHNVFSLSMKGFNETKHQVANQNCHVTFWDDSKVPIRSNSFSWCQRLKQFGRLRTCAAMVALRFVSTRDVPSPTTTLQWTVAKVLRIKDYEKIVSNFSMRLKAMQWTYNMFWVNHQSTDSQSHFKTWLAPQNANANLQRRIFHVSSFHACSKNDVLQWGFSTTSYRTSSDSVCIQVWFKTDSGLQEVRVVIGKEHQQVGSDAAKPSLAVYQAMRC